MTASQSTLITAADRIYVAGHRGMAGSAICRALLRSGYGDPAQGGCPPQRHSRGA